MLGLAFLFAVVTSQAMPAMSAAAQTVPQRDPQCTLDNVETSYLFTHRIQAEGQLKSVNGIAGPKVQPNVADGIYQRTWARFQRCPLAPKTDCTDADVTKPNDEADYRNASNGVQRREDAYDTLYNAFHSCVVTATTTAPGSSPTPSATVSSGCKTAQAVGSTLGIIGAVLPAFRVKGSIGTPISTAGTATAVLTANCASKQANPDSVTASPALGPTPTRATP